jgi:hypothetical protein
MNTNAIMIYYPGSQVDTTNIYRSDCNYVKIENDYRKDCLAYRGRVLAVLLFLIPEIVKMAS